MSPNDTLISAFQKYYNIAGTKFQGDIPCFTHVLNLIIQDILKIIIKNDYNINQDIFNTENDKEEDISSKLFYILIIIFKIVFN